MELAGTARNAERERRHRRQTHDTRMTKGTVHPLFDSHSLTTMSGNPATVPIQERDVLHRMQTTVGGQFLITVIISRLPPPSDGPVIAPSSAAPVAASGADARPQHQLMLQDDAETSSGMKRKRQARHCRRCGVQGCPGGYKRTNCPLYVPDEEFTTTAAIPAAIAQAVMAGEGTSMTQTPPAEKKQRKPRTCRICGRQKCPGNSNRKLCENKPVGWVDKTTPTTPGGGGKDTTTTTGDEQDNDDTPAANASSIVQEDDGKDNDNEESDHEAEEPKAGDDDDAGEKPAADNSENETDV